jgi:HEAT repeat protein
LGLLGDRRAVPVALEMTGPGRGPTTRGAAIKTLEALGRGQAVVVSRLEKLLADLQPPVRKAAAAALGQLGSSAGMLRNVAANDDVPAVRREAARALARIEHP